jgi:release factor glutamine methyltransferase
VISATDPLRRALQWISRELSTSSESPYLDGLVLLEWLLNVEREEILSRLDQPIGKLIATADLEVLSTAVHQRAAGLPVATITGKKEFWGLPYSVGPGVLIPRPDSETLIETVLSTFPPTKGTAIRFTDCCTGSGCIGITIFKELTQRGYLVQGWLSDISPAALKYARANATTHVQPSEQSVGSQLTVLQGNWLEESEGGLDLITANPPYLTDSETDTALASGWQEPREALAAGPDGLDAYRILVPAAFTHLRQDGYFVVECGSTQGNEVARMCTSAGFSHAEVCRDLGGNQRVIRARR